VTIEREFVGAGVHHRPGLDLGFGFDLGFHSASAMEKNPNQNRWRGEPATLRKTADGFFGFGEDAIEQSECFAGGGGDSFAWDNDADQIQRIGGG
jgi:hypothetical protein